jgi:hypothetical protein
MRVEKQFSIFLINKPGVLATVTGALSKAKVNIVALTLADSGEHGVLRVICDKPDIARGVLGKTHDYWSETDVLVMDLKNRPGAFSAVAQSLAKEHIDIAYAYCTGGAQGGKTTAVFKVANLLHAEKVLAGHKLVASGEETVKTSPARGRK